MIRNVWPKPFQYFSSVRAFLITLSVVLSLAVGATYYALYTRTTSLLAERMREQAINYADLLMHAKSWNDSYGGVYVEKRPGVESNAYLLDLGIQPDIRSEQGKVLTIRNHAIMIDEISRRIENHEGTRFRAVSLYPLSPRNTPDSMERSAFKSFEQGEREFYRTELEGGRGAVFRYLLPMYVEESCLECHNSQGYRIGDVIGAISVSIPVNSLLREIKTNRLIILTGGILTVGLLLGILYFLTWRLVRKLDETQQELKKLASTDELTGLKNRRQIMKRLDEEFERAVRLTAPLCIIVLDIDHFKQINDSYGHPCGDQVLMQVAARLSENLRSYDSIGRIGGEEFLVISPGTAVDEAALLADRLLKTIRGTAFKDGPCTFDITISAGISMLSQADQNIDVLIRRADAALYKAKQGGRDMFVVQ